MKLQKISFAIASLFRLSRGPQHDNFKNNNPQNHRLRRRLEGTNDYHHYNGQLISYGQIISNDIHRNACIELQVPEEDTDEEFGTPLILGNCDHDRPGWRFDHYGRIHSEWNDNYCIQVGQHYQKEGERDFTTTKAHQGSKLRLYPCDIDNPNQQFKYHNQQQTIKPGSNQDLCVTWEGNHADVGTDFLVLKSCDEIKSQRHWIGDFPRSKDDESESSQDSYDSE